MSDKDKPKAKISDLPAKPSSNKETEKVKGGRMSSTETGDVTSGPSGGDQG